MDLQIRKERYGTTDSLFPGLAVLSKFVCVATGHFLNFQNMAGRGKVFSYRSNQAIFAITGREYLRGMGQAQISFAFSQQTNGCGWRVAGDISLTDVDGELQETSHWLATALACEYITDKQCADFQTRIEDIGKSLGEMMSMPEKFIPKADH